MASNPQQLIWRTLAISLAIGTAGLAAWYVLMDLPARQELEGRQAEVTRLQQEVAASQGGAAPTALGPIEAELRQLCRQVAEHADGLPQDADRTSFRFGMEELARRAGVRLARIEAAPDLTVGPVQSIGVLMVAEGTPAELRTLTNLIAIHPRMTTLHQLELTQVGGGVATSAPQASEELSREERRRQRRARRNRDRSDEADAPVADARFNASFVVRTYVRPAGTPGAGGACAELLASGTAPQDAATGDDRDGADSGQP